MLPHLIIPMQEPVQPVRQTAHAGPATVTEFPVQTAHARRRGAAVARPPDPPRSSISSSDGAASTGASPLR